MSRLENGLTPYDQDDLEMAADLYKCTITDLLTRPPEEAPKTPEMQLRAAMLSYGVDSEDLGRAVSAVKVFVDDPDEQSSQDPLDDQSAPSSGRRAKEPSQ